VRRDRDTGAPARRRDHTPVSLVDGYFGLTCVPTQGANRIPVGLRAIQLTSRIIHGLVGRCQSFVEARQRAGGQRLRPCDRGRKLVSGRASVWIPRRHFRYRPWKTGTQADACPRLCSLCLSHSNEPGEAAVRTLNQNVTASALRVEKSYTPGAITAPGTRTGL